MSIFAARLAAALAIASALTAAAPNVAFGLDLYVSPDGSGASACAQTAPCTFARADALASPGTTVHAAAGTYGSPVTLAAPGTAAARVRWVSDNRWSAKLTGPVVLHGQYVDLEGFDVAGGPANTIVVLEGDFTRAIGNRVHDLPIGCTSSDGGAGIDATGWVNGGYNGHGQEITGNVVSDVGAGPRDGSCRLVHAIYSSVPDVRIVDNLALRATGWGIHLWHAATRNTIVNNTVYDTGAGGVVVGSGDSGSTIAGDTGTFVSNNVISNVRGPGIAEEGTNVGLNTYVDNLVFGAPYLLSIIGSSAATGTIVADPLFVAPLSDDFHLQAGSPAIDSGSAADAPSIDLDGTLRPQGVGFDRGAFERPAAKTRRGKWRIMSARTSRKSRRAARHESRGRRRHKIR